ncbi:cobyrinate a,c-diamide synthase [Gephyromycinifex aptenodytis]|uniref:cobyrinate a,c-diamide synthase n=1 Tax=Gephyromycinifex aptenodytis TaxID=2716227 RepID=UPI0014464C09|nr:cobyrinate a,c-diamide synthase [Gephyromycinifex aptenodytis]
MNPHTHLPRVLLSAPASGSGKTMITTGLLAALRARGLQVSPHKVGPDYIDPGYHAAACGRVGRNLDAHLVGEDRLIPLLLHGAQTPVPADIAVIEGVMGLFDGALGRRGFSSSAHIASVTTTPVILVVNAASAARSLGAVVHGFCTFDPSVRIGGVILNNLGSPRHESEAREAIAETGVPVLGAIPRSPDVVVPSRHLGLIPASERAPEAADAVAALCELITANVDLDSVLDLARTAPDLDQAPWSADDALANAGWSPGASRPVIAVAGGEAFTFSYAETAELLQAAGAEVHTVDPLRDTLPPDVAGLVIGGGFPEVHAAALSANTELRAQVRDFAAAGGVIHAECAGLLYLGQRLDEYDMCGVLPIETAMGSRLTLGYREAVALTGSALAQPGERVTGHEFHRTRVTARGDVEPAWAWRGHDGAAVHEGCVQDNVHASYLHVNWAGYPQLAARFAAACGAGTVRSR